MRYAPRAILAGGLGFAASVLVACGGGSGLLTGDQSSSLSGQLDQVSAAAQSGQCGAASNASTTLNNAVENLPVTVNPTLRGNLSQGAATVAQLAQTDCRHHTTTTTPPTTSSSTSTTSPTTSTKTSTSTPTSTTTTSTTNTSATTPTGTGTSSTTSGGAPPGGTTSTQTSSTGTTGGTPPGDGNGNGTGNGNGNGGGGG